MKTDIYTKAILTLIAVSLFGILIQMTMQNANAQGQPFYLPPQFKFTQGGALIVSVCDANVGPSRYNCADVYKLERN
jgi:hypothetical protein